MTVRTTPIPMRERLRTDYRWTARQRQVLDLIVRGKSNAEIAAVLEVSLQGAKWHVSAILDKLDAESREEAAEYWRCYNGLAPRFSRVFRGFVGLAAVKWSGAAAGLALVAAGGIAVAVVATPDGGEDEGSAAPAISVTPSLGPTRGATPEPSTPTLGPPRDTSRAEAIETVRNEGGTEVLDLALAGDVDGLLDLIAWEEHRCDDHNVVSRACAESGLAPGTLVPVIHVREDPKLYDREFVAAFLEVLIGTPDAELVFAARKGGRLGISFAIPEPVARPIGGGSPLQGIWFEVIPGDRGTIERIYFFTEFSGPRQFYQAFYQTEGGEMLFFDEDRAPAADPVPTPDAPPTRP